ncbi:MAG: c-type cytochrome domain-containing protein, partial [Verrucomicrobiota bacterium]
MKTHAKILSLSLFTAASAVAQDAEKITYEDHVRPLLENKCFSCHSPDKKKGDLDLTSFGAVMTGGGGGAVVDSGNSDASRLWTTCAKKEEPFMPPEGAPLNAKELEILAKWISGGLLETKSSVAKKSSKPKVDMAVAVTSGKPEGPIAKPEHVLLEPVVVTPRTTAVTAMAASPWTSLAAIAGTKQILLYDTDTRQLAGIFPYTEGYARSLRFSRNGSLLVMGGGKGGKLGHAIVWDVKTGKRIVEVGKEFDQVMSADISPDHKMVVIGSPSKKVKVYDTATGEELYMISKHTEWIMGTAFSPDGVLLATSDRNGNVMVWEAATGGEFYVLGQHKASCTDLAWRADSNILASCSMDGTISLWEMNEGKQVKNWAAHGGGVQSVSFTPDGKLISSGNDGLVRTWDINGNKIGEAASQGDIVTKVIALHDSQSTISANWRGEIKVWSVEAKMTEKGQISSNPPLIAQRIVESEKQATVLVAQLPEVEAKLKKAQESVQAAEALLAETKKKAADAQARVVLLETEVKELPAQIAAAEKAVTETQAKKAAQAELLKKHDQYLAEIKTTEA